MDNFDEDNETYNMIKIKSKQIRPTTTTFSSITTNQKVVGGECECVGDYLIRTIPKQPRQFYMKSFESISLFRQKVALFQMFFELDGNVVIHKVLERLESGCLSLKIMINFIIDEVAQKIFICTCVGDKTQLTIENFSVEKIELKEYDFIFDHKSDNGQRKIVSVTERKKSQVSIDFGMASVKFARLLIFPSDGAFILHVIRWLPKGQMEHTFGYLYKKKKTDRVLFFTPTKSIITQHVEWTYFIDSRSKLYHIVPCMTEFTPKQTVDISFSIDQSTNISLNHITVSIKTDKQKFNLFSLLPFEEKNALRKKFGNSIDFNQILEDYFEPLGCIYKLFFFQLNNILVGMKIPKNSLKLLPGIVQIVFIMTLENQNFKLFLCASNIIIYYDSKYDHTVPKIAHIPLTSGKYSRKLKGYRICAMCNKMEKKKRKNKKGQRIADFKVILVYSLNSDGSIRVNHVLPRDSIKSGYGTIAHYSWIKPDSVETAKKVLFVKENVFAQNRKRAGNAFKVGDKVKFEAVAEPETNKDILHAVRVEIENVYASNNVQDNRNEYDISTDENPVILKIGKRIHNCQGIITHSNDNFYQLWSRDLGRVLCARKEIMEKQQTAKWLSFTAIQCQQTPNLVNWIAEDVQSVPIPKLKLVHTSGDFSQFALKEVPCMIMTVDHNWAIGWNEQLGRLIIQRELIGDKNWDKCKLKPFCLVKVVRVEVIQRMESTYSNDFCWKAKEVEPWPDDEEESKFSSLFKCEGQFKTTIYGIITLEHKKMGQIQVSSKDYYKFYNSPAEFEQNIQSYTKFEVIFTHIFKYETQKTNGKWRALYVLPLNADNVTIEQMGFKVKENDYYEEEDEEIAGIITQIDEPELVPVEDDICPTSSDVIVHSQLKYEGIVMEEKDKYMIIWSRDIGRILCPHSFVKDKEIVGKWVSFNAKQCRETDDFCSWRVTDVIEIKTSKMSLLNDCYCIIMTMFNNYAIAWNEQIGRILIDKRENGIQDWEKIGLKPFIIIKLQAQVIQQGFGYYRDIGWKGTKLVLCSEDVHKIPQFSSLHYCSGEFTTKAYGSLSLNHNEVGHIFLTYMDYYKEMATFGTLKRDITQHREFEVIYAPNLLHFYSGSNGKPKWRAIFVKPKVPSLQSVEEMGFTLERMICRGKEHSERSAAKPLKSHSNVNELKKLKNPNDREQLSDVKRRDLMENVHLSWMNNIIPTLESEQITHLEETEVGLVVIKDNDERSLDDQHSTDKLEQTNVELQHSKDNDQSHSLSVQPEATFEGVTNASGESPDLHKTEGVGTSQVHNNTNVDVEQELFNLISFDVELLSLVGERNYECLKKIFALSMNDMDVIRQLGLHWDMSCTETKDNNNVWDQRKERPHTQLVFELLNDNVIFDALLDKDQNLVIAACGW